MYWRPHKVSRAEVVLVMVLALSGAIAVEKFTVQRKQEHYHEKVEAARKTKRAFEVIKAVREASGWRRDPEVDPANTGLIGQLMSPVTTNSGHLPAKQISVNPNFSALVVHYLKRLDIQKGDAVAVGLSGSFPAINIAVIGALEALEVRPLVISSASASQFGANDPDMVWLDMERVLAEREVFKTRSIAASRGGIEDRGLGVTRVGRELLDAALERSGIKEIIRAPNYNESVKRRMEVYAQAAEGRPIKAYVNVGGGTTSVGTKVGKRLFTPGINRTAPAGASQIDSVMTRFIAEGVPVIHLVKIADLATRYGFPLEMTEMPPVGQGRIFSREVYNVWLASFVVLLVFGSLVAFVRTDWGYRLLKRSSGAHGPRKPPEQMV